MTATAASFVAFLWRYGHWPAGREVPAEALAFAAFYWAAP